jgi:hypothetical protein
VNDVTYITRASQSERKIRLLSEPFEERALPAAVKGGRSLFSPGKSLFVLELCGILSDADPAFSGRG